MCMIQFVIITYCIYIYIYVYVYLYVTLLSNTIVIIIEIEISEEGIPILNNSSDATNQIIS